MWRGCCGFLCVLLLTGSAWAADPVDEIRHVVIQFQQGLANHDIEKIEPLMADDMVAFENGGRNDGWADFRDNHLAPEFSEPAPPMHWEIVRVKATAQMGWAYTRTTMKLTLRNGQEVEATLWSVYVVEKRGAEWKITLLDWSLRVPRPRPAS